MDPKPKAPRPPDPAQTMAAQTGANTVGALANTALQQVDQRGPTGSVTYSTRGNTTIRDPNTGRDIKIPNRVQTTNLTPRGQRTFDTGARAGEKLAQLGLDQTNRISGVLNSPFSLKGIAPVESGMAARDKAEAALMERMNPQLERDRDSLRTSLSGQGIKIGSEAYDRGMADFGRQSNDARLGAILGAGVEGDRIFNQSLGARQQGVEEAFAVRNQPMNEIGALLSGGQVGMPNFGAVPTASMPTTDAASLINGNYDQRQANYGQQMGQYNSMMGGLFGLGAAGIGAIPPAAAKPFNPYGMY